MPHVILLIFFVLIVALGGFLFWNQREQNVNNVAGSSSLRNEVQSTLHNRVLSDQNYVDGMYTAITTYFTPKRVEHTITTTLDIQHDIIVAATVTYDGTEAKTPSHLRFDEAYASEVLGVNLDDLNFSYGQRSRIGGASLTTVAFDEAIEKIKGEALNAQN